MSFCGWTFRSRGLVAAETWGKSILLMQRLSDLWVLFGESFLLSFGAIMNTTNTLDLLGFQVFSPMTCWNEVPLCTPIVLYTINIHPQNETLAVQVALIHPDQLPTSETKRKAQSDSPLYSPGSTCFFLKWVIHIHVFWYVFKRWLQCSCCFFIGFPYLRKDWTFFWFTHGFHAYPIRKSPFWKPGVRTTRILWKRYGLRGKQIIAERVMSDLVGHVVMGVTIWVFSKIGEAQNG